MSVGKTARAVAEAVAGVVLGTVAALVLFTALAAVWLLS